MFYILFIKKADLPRGVGTVHIVKQLETLYGHVSQFRSFEYDLTYLVEFPTAELQEKAFSDGLNFGPNT